MAQPTFKNKTAVRWIMAIYFCSGICSLIDEVVWVRLLKLTLGNTVYASAIVVSMFMGGLALGSFIMARYSDQIKKPLRIYAILELCATISALLVPLILHFTDEGYRWFYLKYQMSPVAVILAQIIISALILLAPAMVMGSTLPLLGRYVTNMEKQVGRFVGKLYYLNMLGAALGCFLAGFVLIKNLGVMGALYIAAGINLIVAIGGWILSRKSDTAEASEVKKTPAIITSEVKSTKNYILAAAFFCSGLISIGYEMLWMRSISIPVGGYTYVFSAVLTVYLLGNIIGAAIGSLLSKRLRQPAVGFGLSLSFLGFFGILYIPWFSQCFLKIIPYNIYPMFKGWFDTPGIIDRVIPLVSSLLLFLIPTIMMGIGFPLALQAWVNVKHKIGQTTGFVYGINTIGAVFGGLVTTFVLIPLLGTHGAVILLGLLGICLGGAMIQTFLGKVRLRRHVVFAIISIGFIIPSFLTPSELFKKNMVVALKTRPLAILAIEEGTTSTVAVHRESSGYLTLSSEGVAIAGDGKLRVPQKTLGHLGPLLNKDAKTVLAIGFGSGETTACLSQHDLERIECVEISEEVVRMALSYFEHINLGEQLEQKVNMKYMDGKNFLHLTDKRYDIIINGADAPLHSGSSQMFCKEHFMAAREHLNTNGLFITKAHIGDLSKEIFDSILGTFTDVYPYTTAWFPITRPYTFFYLIGSSEPQKFSVSHIDNELERANIKESASYMNFHSSVDILNGYIGDENDIRRYLGKYHTNSNYTPYVEFAYRDSLEKWPDLFAQFIEKTRRNSIYGHIDWTGVSEEKQKKWKQQYQSAYNVSTYILKSHAERDIMTVLQNCKDGLLSKPGHAPLLFQETQALRRLQKDILSNQTNIHQISADINAKLANYPQWGAAWLMQSWAYQRTADSDKALQAARQAVKYAPNQVMAQIDLASMYQRSGKTKEAVKHYRLAAEINPNLAQVHFNLANIHYRNKEVNLAMEHYRQAVRIMPHVPDYHYNLAAVSLKSGQTESAVHHFRQTLRFNPKHFIAMNNLAWIWATHPETVHRNGPEAVRLALHICKETDFKQPVFLDTLSAAYAQNGRFNKAIENAEKALELAMSSGRHDIAENIRNRLQLYRAGQPYREKL
ncbi:fused MFS/spermidine synthase [Planctomycetota bacterium]